MISLRSYIKHLKECFIRDANTSKKKTKKKHFSEFGILMKHSSLCLKHIAYKVHVHVVVYGNRKQVVKRFWSVLQGTSAVSKHVGKLLTTNRTWFYSCQLYPQLYPQLFLRWQTHIWHNHYYDFNCSFRIYVQLPFTRFFLFLPREERTNKRKSEVELCGSLLHGNLSEVFQHEFASAMTCCALKWIIFFFPGHPFIYLYLYYSL